jgi:hypothetical protein
MDAVSEPPPWSTPSVTELHSAGALFRIHTGLRAALIQVDAYGRKLADEKGPGGHPGVNPMWIEILRDELGDYLQAEKSAGRPPKQEACLEWIRDQLRARGWKIGTNVILERIIRPALLIVRLENC